MKRLLTMCILGIIATLVSMSCSQKYEPPTGQTTDTVTVHDTIHDTVTVIDTLPPDTVIIIDTVVITNPKDSTCQKCGTIEGSVKYITWNINRPAGTYILTFQATTEKDNPPQSLTVTVDGVATEWLVANQPMLVLTRTLSQSTIIVTSNTPHAYGHGITICLTIKRE